jgi:predicted RNase H-like HicB family nuclease
MSVLIMQVQKAASGKCASPFLTLYVECGGPKSKGWRISTSMLYFPATLKESNMFKVREHEKIVRIHIAKLPEGVYLATSDDVQGLVAQGRSVAETLEIARDVARKLLEAENDLNLPTVGESFDYPLIVEG